MGCNKKYFIFTCVAVAILFIPIIAGASCTNCGKLRYLEITDVAYKENNPEKAITEFQDFIKHCPEGEWTTYARLQIGNCFLGLNDEEQARKYFEEVIRLDWNECTTKQASGCIEHLDSGHKTPYPLNLKGTCPICRK